MTFEYGKHYTRDEIHAALGGGKQAYLPTSHGRVVAGCFLREANPDAPDVVLPGFGRDIERTANLFASQGNAVPVFMKRTTNKWRYVGCYRVMRQSEERAEIAEHAARAKRHDDVSQVLVLNRETLS